MILYLVSGYCIITVRAIGFCNILFCNIMFMGIIYYVVKYITAHACLPIHTILLQGKHAELRGEPEAKCLFWSSLVWSIFAITLTILIVVGITVPLVIILLQPVQPEWTFLHETDFLHAYYILVLKYENCMKHILMDTAAGGLGLIGYFFSAI